MKPTAKGTPFLQIHLADQCNLNCKGCAHFSPVAAPWFIPADELMAMYEKIRPVMDRWFCRLELMGGEPLLHPDIIRIMEMTRRMFPGLEVRIVTNGLMIPGMEDRFFEACAENQMTVCLSAYPIRLDYDALERTLSGRGIRFLYNGAKDSSKRFLSYRLNPEGGGDSRVNFERCRYGGRCIQLRNHRIFPCFVSAYAPILNERFGTDFRWGSGDFLSLEAPFDTEAFERLISGPVPFCRYCDMEHQDSFDWDYSLRRPEEWLIRKEGSAGAAGETAVRPET